VRAALVLGVVATLRFQRVPHRPRRRCTPVTATHLMATATTTTLAATITATTATIIATHGIATRKL
jgi:hypothetical protein